MCGIAALANCTRSAPLASDAATPTGSGAATAAIGDAMSNLDPHVVLHTCCLYGSAISEAASMGTERPAPP